MTILVEIGGLQKKVSKKKNCYTHFAQDLGFKIIL